MRQSKWFLALPAVMGFVALAAPAQGASVTDFVFIVDASASMGDNIADVRAGLDAFITNLDVANIDARYSLVLFGGHAEIVLDFTSTKADVIGAFNQISVSGAVAGFQNNHNTNPEAGLEAIRMVLGGAVDNDLDNNNIAGDGTLNFRSGARKNLILVTDEDSDLPFILVNRFAGQTTNEPPSPLSTAWQNEVDATADAVIAANAFLNMLINTDARSKSQYGDPASDVADADLLNYDPDATLLALQAAGFGNTLQAQVLAADLIARTFSIALVDDANFVNNFFAAKLAEVQDDPGVNGVPLPAAAWSGLALLAPLGGARRVRRARAHG